MGASNLAQAINSAGKEPQEGCSQTWDILLRSERFTGRRGDNGRVIGEVTDVRAEGGEDLFAVANEGGEPQSLFCRCISSIRSTTATRDTMRVNGLHLPQLTQFCPRVVGEINPIAPYRCYVHRTICHHALRPSNRVAGPVSAHLEHRRGAKTKSTLKLKDLPQGALKLEPYSDGADHAPQYPAVVQGHRNNMQKFKNCVVLTRVGGFYEVRHFTLCSESALYCF